MKSEVKQAEIRPLLKVTAAIIEKDGTVLIAKRRPGVTSGGFWEFPGGKLEQGEEPEIGLARELAEELGIESRIGEFVCSVPFRAHGLAIELLAYRAALSAGEIHLSDHDEIRWLAIGDLDETMFTEPDRPVVRLLKSGNAGRGEKIL